MSVKMCADVSSLNLHNNWTHVYIPNARTQLACVHADYSLSHDTCTVHIVDMNSIGRCGVRAHTGVCTARHTINARERRRMHDLNAALDELRSVIPCAVLRPPMNYVHTHLT